jgi:hypothetical protein
LYLERLAGAHLVIGFSYAETEEGSLNPVTGAVEDASFAGVQGRYPKINATLIGMLVELHELGIG